MRVTPLLLLAAAAAVAALAVAAAEPKVRWHEVQDWPFERYVQEFGKSYATNEEYAVRAKIYNARVADIMVHNKDETKTWKRTITRFADQEDNEFYHGFKPRAKPSTSLYAMPYVEPAVPAGTPLPDNVDWRKQGVVTGVKDQGQCGSCYAHAGTEQLESYMALSSGSLPVLSQQQASSCTFNPKDCGGTGGCGGGTAEVVIDSVAKRGGMASIWTYPYLSYWGENYDCKFNNTAAAGGTPAVITVDGHVTLPANNYTATMRHLAFVGPLGISVDAAAWHDYDSGVYDGCGRDTVTMDHNVQMVGYGTDPVHGDYWLVRNSWGIVFGEEGYIRVRRFATDTPCAIDHQPQDGDGCNGGPSQIEVCGSCGILYDNVYPVNVRGAQKHF